MLDKYFIIFTAENYPDTMPPIFFDEERVSQQLQELGIDSFVPEDGLLYKYVSYDTAVKILTTSTLRFSQPAAFNDPFDLTTELIDLSYSNSDLKKWAKDYEPVDRGRRKDFLKNNKAGSSDFKDRLLKGLLLHKEQLGICCFSKSPHKTLMWSHYANSHQGICMGFALDSQLFDQPLNIMSVHYAHSIKPVNFFKEPSLAILHWAFTKSSVWAYEEEVRAMFQARHGNIVFPKSCLREIYFGLRLTGEQEQNIVDLIIENRYTKINKTSRMVMNAGTFDLREDIMV